jgi:hypothetical protein
MVTYCHPASQHSNTIHNLRALTEPPHTMPLFTEYLFPPSLSRQYHGSQVLYFLSASQHNNTAHTFCTSIKLPRQYHNLHVIYFHSAFVVNSTFHKFCIGIQTIQLSPLFTGCATNPDLIT